MDKKTLELAWAAGFYDGEGSSKRLYSNYKTKSGIKQSPGVYVVMTVSQSELNILKRFKKAVNNIGTINGPYQYERQRRPYWVWSVSCLGARNVFKLLKPYLGFTKRKQYYTVLRQNKHILNRKKAWIYDEK